VLFVSGCLLRCTYCHNPDTWHLKDGTYVSADHVLRRLGDFAPALRPLGGGLTISGGEPMVQLAFTRRDIRRREGIGSAYRHQTSGFLGDRADESYLSTSISCCSTSRVRIPTPIAGDRPRPRADAALRGTPCFAVQAGLGPLHLVPARPTIPPMSTASLVSSRR
jgi:hypothetical protein